MIDIHSHILPEVDDGAPSLDVALSMLEVSALDGVKTQVLTPHMHPGRYDNKIDDLQKNFELFSAEVSQSGIDIELKLAAEIHIRPDIPLLSKSDKLLWIGQWNGAKVFLLEFPFNQIPHGSLNLIQWLVKHNIKPLLAHPERYQAFQSSPSKLSEYVAAGCLVQLTTSSLTGQFGKDSYLAAEYFLKNGMAHFIASDCHNLDRRAPGLSEAVNCAAEMIGEAQAKALVEDNPARLLSTKGESEALSFLL
jgi:protein-tyrosine phosphatase